MRLEQATLTVAERARFDHYLGGPTASGCREWTGGKFRNGYGKFWLHGKNRRAARVAWIIAHGSIPRGLDVLHRCDNPPCCEVGHLFVGTSSDNARDAFDKGRRHPPIERARGVANGRARFTESEITKIRLMYAWGYTQRQIAETYGTTQPRISEIVRLKTWRHV